MSVLTGAEKEKESNSDKVGDGVGKGGSSGAGNLKDEGEWNGLYSSRWCICSGISSQLLLEDIVHTTLRI